MTTDIRIVTRAIAVAVVLVLGAALLAVVTMAHRGPASRASAPTGTGCIVINQNVSGRTTLHTKICIPNGPIR